MAKKKQTKEKKTSPLGDFAYELTGIGLFILTVFKIGNLGLVGTFLRRISVIFFGEFFWLFGIIVAFLSVKMVLFRQKPKLFERRHVGIYLVFISAIILAHTPVWRRFVTLDLTFIEGIGQFYLTADVLEPGILLGGGVFGAFIYFVFAPLMTWMGLWFVAFILLGYGTLLLFNTSIKELYENRKPGQLKEKLAKIKGSLPNRVAPKKDPKAPAPKKEVKKKVPKVAKEDVVFEETPEVIFKVADFGKREKKDVSVSRTVGAYTLPPESLLVTHESDGKSEKEAQEKAKKTADLLEETFDHFDVKASVSEVHIGPTVTRFEISPARGVKVSKITGLMDEIALALAVKGVRMEAPIPGKSAIGIEVPNAAPRMVSFKEMMSALPENKQDLSIILGRDISGAPIVAELNKMPHVLVAGATGSGKSVCINTMICSLLMQFSPEEVKMILVDPKKVELGRYNGLPHLLTDVVTDPKLASSALKKVVAEMEKRYDQFSDAGVRDIASYNAHVKKKLAAGTPEGTEILEPMPFVIVILDELADLMMVASKEVEDSIMRLTQMARAAGIHLVVATQRPSVDVITGVIKSNIPSRIAFGVSSGVDSRTILDTVGAEKLLGRGDMLYLPMGASAPVRVQGAFITDNEVSKIVEFIKGQNVEAEAAEDFLADVKDEAEGGGGSNLPSDDPLIRDVLAFVFESQKASASMLQRRFKIGYNRAARLIDDLEAAGLVTPADGSKGRTVLLDEETYRELIG